MASAKAGKAKGFRVHWVKAALMGLVLVMPISASAQNVTIPEIGAFLPNITEVKPSKPMAIDGLWKVSTIDKLVRIDRGRIYVIEGWNHLFLLKIKPGMVTVHKIKEEGDGVYTGEDLPLSGPITIRVTGDRILDAVVDGAAGEYKYQMIPQDLDDPDWFKKEVLAARKREAEAN